VIGQFVTVSTAGILTGNGVRGSVTASLALGQIGEFAFIIASIGATAGIVGEFLSPVVVTVAVLTAFSTPLLVRASGRIANAVDHALPRPLQTFASLCESWFEALRSSEASRKSRSHLRNSAIVIAIDGLAIAGVWAVVVWWQAPLRGLVSDTLGLGPASSRLVVVVAGVLATAPLVFAILRSARRAGQLLAERVIPVGREGEVDLGRAPRRALVMTLQLVVVLVVAMPVLVFVTPVVGTAWGLVVTGALVVGLSVYLWRSAADLQGHVRAGATALGELLQQQMAQETAPVVPELLPGLGTTTAITIETGWHADGRSLAELDVRAATGATIVAIARDGETRPMPSGHDRLAVGDTVVLAGADHAVEAARQRLTQPEG
jgi:CPA2 family monovalent cation:H+ antiporter-2